MKKKYYTQIKVHYQSELLDSFLSSTNEIYNVALQEKSDSKMIWDEVVRYYKSKGYARDVTNVSHLHTNTLIIGINGIIEGIILNISFLPKYIGYYFYHQNEKAMIPIIDKFGMENSQLSFYPFNRDQEKYCIEILDFISNLFPTFKLFENLYANEKVTNIIMDNTIVKESTFFQVIFEDNMCTIF
jgi:hypothetical protein